MERLVESWMERGRTGVDTSLCARAREERPGGPESCSGRARLIRPFAFILLVSCASLVLATSAAAAPFGGAVTLIWTENGERELLIDPADPAKPQLAMLLLHAGDAGVSEVDLSLVFDFDGGDELDFIGGHGAASDRFRSSEHGYQLRQESEFGRPGVISGIDLVATEALFNQPIILGWILFSINPENLRGDSTDLFPILRLDDQQPNFFRDASGNEVDLFFPAMGSSVRLPEPTTLTLMLIGLATFALSARRREARVPDWHRF